MKKPFWRKQSKTWVIRLPGGRMKTLGRDEHGATRKHPPREIEEAWHALDRKRTPVDMLMADVAALYLEYLTNPGTRKSAREHLNYFLAHVGPKMKVSALRVHDVNGYLATKNWAESTRATAINRITSALNWAKGEGYIDEHKVVYAKGKKPRYARRDTLLTDAQLDRIEAAASPRLRALLAALRESGCRPGELCGALIERVEGRILLVANKVARKTGETLRPVCLSPRLLEIIAEESGDRETGPIFLNAYGRPWKPATIAHRVRRIRIGLGLPKGLVPYLIRHKWASDAINSADANPAHVARMMGHSDLEMLMRNYYKADPEAMLRTMDKIAGR